MNSKIEIHDSRVAGICKCDGTVTVHFVPAYLHKSEGRPAYDSGTGWVQEAWIIVDGERHNNLIPVPFETGKFTELRLICDSVHTVTVKGRAVRLELAGEPRFVEEFPHHKAERKPG
jgi:hypothetical protein